jgi:hypothetical protein
MDIDPQVTLEPTAPPTDDQSNASPNTVVPAC